MPDEERLATYTILPATRSEVDTSLETAQGLIQALDNYKGDTETLSQIMNEAHTRAKDLDGLRLTVAKPAHEAKKAVDDFFRPALAAWKEAKGKSKALINEALRAQELARQQALASVAKSPPAAAPAALAAVPAPAAPPAGVALRHEVHIEIIDAGLIPEEYWCIDWSALKIAAREGKEVPGVEFVREQKAMVGRK